MQIHERNSCPKALVECDNAGCGQWMTREELKKHKVLCQTPDSIQRDAEAKRARDRLLAKNPALKDYFNAIMVGRRSQIKWAQSDR